MMIENGCARCTRGKSIKLKVCDNMYVFMYACCDPRTSTPLECDVACRLEATVKG